MLISVIVPAYNEAGNIKNCLTGLAEQTFPREEYEIIVVDDGSTDGTASVVQGFPGVRLIRQVNQGPAAARNLGVQEATGEIVLFTDADCIPQPEWIAEMVRPLLENPEVVAVKGAYETRQRGWTARFVQLEFEDRYDRLKKQQYIDFIDTYAAAYRREVFLEAGGFSLDFRLPSAEDAALGFHLANQGYKMVFNPRARVIHLHPDTPRRYLWKKYFFAYWRLFAVMKTPNKIVGDSYSPQLMKLQVVLFPLLLGSVGLLPATRTMVGPAWLLGLFYVLTTVPFLIKAWRRDRELVIPAPFFLLLRSAGQFGGLVTCVWDYFIKKKKQSVELAPDSYGRWG